MSSSSDKILSAIERFDFLAETLITYKYPNDVSIFHQVLVLLESIKFYYRVRKLSRMNIFIRDETVPESKQPPKLVLPSEVIGSRV